MLYTGIGLLLGARGLGLIRAELENEFITLIAEVTLILMLFSIVAHGVTSALGALVWEQYGGRQVRGTGCAR